MNEQREAGEAKRQGPWSIFREAIRGSQQDFTTIPVGKAVFLLAVPMVLEMSMESLFGIVDVLFSKQADWAAETDPQAMTQKLYSIGRQAGMTDAEMDACMQDRAMAEALVAEYQKNAEADGVDATPTFLIDGKKVGNMGYDEFEAALNAALGA